MSSDPFVLLGLDRKAATEADIRKAYAERLKLTRPEDDRAAFMALREAFERARQEARWRVEYPDEEDEDDEAGTTLPAPQPATEPATPDYRESGEATDTREDPCEDEAEEDYVPSDMERRIETAMEKLNQLLTSPWGPPNTADISALLNHPDLEGIDEYRVMQWNVRNFICHATGYYSQTQEMQLPSWLTLQVFDELNAHFGWIRQPSSHPAERHLNAWLRQVRKSLSWYAMSYEERVQKERERLLSRRPPQEIKDSYPGSGVWLFLGVGILVFFIMRALTGFGS
ncbi:MAG: hypothetical protein CVT79_00215 [Alphaproteobacteria bacterium HGW-Alphaproteobacteria-18]|nr:MAG: hypothetical protein CVT79_00215 [Alphaproteobacteria bacterium HGW-Alphaproteobacteria-18]